MDVNGWLTVVTIFIAFLALMSSNERKLFLWLNRKWLWPVIFLNGMVVPFILHSDKMIGWLFVIIGQEVPRVFFHKDFFAFLIVYCTFLWIALREIPIPKGKTGNIYENLLRQLPFDEFYRLYSKHENRDTIKRNMEQHRELILNDKFLLNIQAHDPDFLVDLWKELTTTKGGFSKIMKLFLKDKTSPYYKELKNHWNSGTLLEDARFLSQVAEVGLGKSFDMNLMGMILDHSQEHLEQNVSANQLYNKDYYEPDSEKGKIQIDFPIYRHVQFVGLMYCTAIGKKVDTQKVSANRGNRQYFFQTIIELMLAKMKVRVEGAKESYFEWAIFQIMDVHQDMMSQYLDVQREDANDNRTPFPEDNSYVTFILSSLGLCIKALFKGVAEGKLDENSVISAIHFSALKFYWKQDLPEDLRTSMESDYRAILSIPESKRPKVFGYSLNESLASNWRELEKGEYGPGVRPAEKIILDRLRGVLGLNYSQLRG